MHSLALFASGYSRRTLTGLAALFVLVATSAHAQVACKLLQPAELESTLKDWALGGKATKFSGTTYSAGGTAYDLCSSEIVRPGKGNLQIKVTIVKDLNMNGGEAIRIRNAGLGSEGQWKAKGAQFEEKNVGKAICTLTGRPGSAARSVCAIPRGSGFVEVEVIAPTQKETPSMDAVATLVQQANSRM